MSEIIILTKENENIWKDYAAKKKDSTIFHSLEYRDLIVKNYGYVPVYLMLLEEGVVKGALVSFYSNTLLGGKKIQTLPFGAYCDILYEDEKFCKEMINKLIEIGEGYGVKVIELKLKSRIPHIPKFIERSHYCITELKLSTNVEEVLDKYNKKHRKNLRYYWRKAEKKGITIRHIKNEEDIKQFYRIYMREMRDKHRMLPRAYSLIKSIFDIFSPLNNVDLLIAEYNNKIIAGIILYYYNRRVIYEFSATDNKYDLYSPTVLLIDYAIQKSCKEGYQIFDFSITSLRHQSLLDFKTKWGSTIIPLPYYYLFKSKKLTNITDYMTSYSFIRKIYRFVPLVLIKKLSKRVTRELA